MLKIATWNVNSVNARLPNLIEWLEFSKPDVVLLQELKCQENNFPRIEIGSLNYHAELVGQKAYNGVAILSKQPIKIHHSMLPGNSNDEQARYIEVDTFGLRFASIYLPNGNPSENGKSDKFLYKLDWMSRLIVRAKRLIKKNEPFVLGGDFNICPTDDDLYDPKAFTNDALCLPEARLKFFELMNLGLVNAVKALDNTTRLYSYWDYQRGAWQKNDGLLIDHLILSPQIADRLIDSGIDKTPRGKEKPSDHTPVWCHISEQNLNIP
ncbi:MAG: Exodeoxyribonuclease III [Alphaproteobacteria bacterium MarineAlpha3_Bin5]|nr:MAG: Exodeoxyribonuclease III [Alphaproteobacteria bacterium MarineAlpha3_Bin5]|tara:strand:+ start:324 stop:1124 length:801 start_codon:yes stop_codon:yes gene_type:complete